MEQFIGKKTADRKAKSTVAVILQSNTSAHTKESLEVIKGHK